MPLNDKQRAWLDVAIQQKGRFTTKKKVRKQLDAYIRRRAKTADAVAALSDTHPNYQQITDGLKHADGLAKNGDLKGAYSYLDTIKRLAKAEAAGLGALIQVDTVRVETNRISQEFAQQIREINGAHNAIASLFAEMERAPKAGDCATIGEAITFRQNFGTEELRFRGAFQGIVGLAQTAAQNMLNRNLLPSIEQLSKDIAAIKATNRAKDVADFDKVVVRIQEKCRVERRKYSSDANVRSMTDDYLADFERAINACKSLERWQKRDPSDDVGSDEKAEAVLSNLSHDDAAHLELVRREEERLQRACDEVAAEYAMDRAAFDNTDRADYAVQPPLPKFVSGDVLNDLADGIDVSDVVSDQDADTIAQRAADALANFVTDATSDPHEVFDLTLKSAEELMDMISGDILGTTNSADWTPSQTAMINKALEEVQNALATNLPNQIADDESSISVGGVVYGAPQVLKQGGNGRAVRYTAANGNTIVVKSGFATNEYKKQDQQEKLAYELETHHRAMEGRDPSAANDAIVDLHGAARNKDGELYMILEDVQGGDLDDLNRAMSAAARSGMISEEARQALAMANLLDAVRGMKDLERQGLVHHDIKGENIMMTSDGRIKIIDYGEAEYVDDDEKVTAYDRGGTPGYMDPNIYDEQEGHDTRADLFAIGGMLQRLVADLSPQDSFDETKMETGALGRLVKALRDPDASKRPTLDAILQSSIAKSYESDFNVENVKELQAASADFAQQATKIEGTVDLVSLAAQLPANKMANFSDPMKLKSLQEEVVIMEAQAIELGEQARNNPDAFLLGGHAELKKLQEDIAFVQLQIINPMLEQAADDAEDAYRTALEDPNIKFDVAVGGKQGNVTLKQAVQLRDKVISNIERVQMRSATALSDLDDHPNLDAITRKMDQINDLLTALYAEVQTLEDQIYAAVGDDAKFHLAKARMEKASAAFGPVGSPESETGVEDTTGINQLVSDLETEDVRDELKRVAEG